VLPIETVAAAELMQFPQSIADAGIGELRCPAMGSRWVSRPGRVQGWVLLPSTASTGCPIPSRPPSPSPLAAVQQLPGTTFPPHSE